MLGGVIAEHPRLLFELWRGLLRAVVEGDWCGVRMR